jgi:hypothetical protein
MANLRKSGNGGDNMSNGDGDDGENNDNMSNGNNNAGDGGEDDENNKRERKNNPDDNGDDDDDDDDNEEEGELGNPDDDDWEFNASGEKDKKRKSSRSTRSLRKSSNTVVSDATQLEDRMMSIEKTEPGTEQQSEERLRQMQSLLWANMSPVFLQFLAWQRLVDIGQHLERAQQIANADSNDDRVQKILNEAHKQDDMIATHMTWLDTWKSNLDMQQQVINPRPTKRARPKNDNEDDEPPNKRRKQEKADSPNTGNMSTNIATTVANMYNLPAPSISPPVTPTPGASFGLAKKPAVAFKTIAPAGPVGARKPASPKASVPGTIRAPAKTPFARPANLPRDTRPPNGQTKHTWKIPLPDQPIRGAIASLTGVSDFDTQPFQFNMFAHKICIGRGMPVLEFDVAKYTDCKTISHKHASIEFNPDKKCFIFNNHGRNGTRINDEQIGGKLGVNVPLVLYPDDVIEMGRFRMTFHVYKPTGFETIYDNGPPPE